jgi:hypothetical protein
LTGYLLSGFLAALGEALLAGLLAAFWSAGLLVSDMFFFKNGALLNVRLFFSSDLDALSGREWLAAPAALLHTFADSHMR